MHGARKPPSSTVPFPPANGVWPPSGQVKFSAPLSVVNMRMVFSSRPSSLSFFITAPTMSSSCAMPASEIDQPFSDVRIASYFRRKVRDDVHARGVEPHEEGLIIRLGLVDELQRVIEDLVVNGFHAIWVERPAIFDFLLADLAPARLNRWVVVIGGPAVEHIARADLLFEGLRIIAMRGVFHRVEVVQVTEELVEAVQRRQILVEIAEVVLAELARGVSHRLESGRDGRRFVGHADLRPGLPDGRQARTNGKLAGDEVRAAGGAAGLRVVVGEAHAFGREAVEVRRAARHDSLVIGADIEPADIVGHDGDNVRCVLGGHAVPFSRSIGERSSLKIAGRRLFWVGRASLPPRRGPLLGRAKD